MNPLVYYTLWNNDRKKKFSHICFSNVYYHIKDNGFKDSDYLTYKIKNYNKLSEKEIYQYLLFMRRIPEFKPLLPQPQRISKELTYTTRLNANQQKVFITLTILRGIDEFPRLIKAILKHKNNKQYTPLYLLRLLSCSRYLVDNNGHWLCGVVENKELLKLPITNLTEGYNKPIYSGSFYGVYNFMNYTYKWGVVVPTEVKEKLKELGIKDEDN